MTTLEPGPFRWVNSGNLPRRPSTITAGVFVKDIAVTEGWEIQIVRFEPVCSRLPVHVHERPEFHFTRRLMEESVHGVLGYGLT